MSSNTKRAIEIERVSSDSQDCSRQRQDLDRNKAAYGLEIARTLKLEGISGRKVLSNREVQRVLADLQRPDVDGVSISALDRLFRLDTFADFGILDPFRETGKMIWSAKEGALDLRTDAGLIISLMSGAQSGLEWRELRRRTAGGKELLRTRGGAPNTGHSLPRGVGVEPVKDHKGHTIGAKWFYTEPDASRIRKAYDLVFERLSWRDIAARVGGGFTYNGIKLALKNPIFKGVRRYTAGREEPLEIQVIDEPLIAPARWEVAQRLILEKRTKWLKTKRQPHNLLSGLLTCACGKPCYVRTSGRGTYYYCSSSFPGHGPKCGAKSVQQPAADSMVEEFVSHLDAKFWAKAFRQMRTTQPARDQEAEKLVRQREKLEAERQKLLRLTLKGKCSEDDFSRESKRIQTEIADLDRLAPAPAPAAVDPRKMTVQIARTFGRFGKQPFEGKRAVLRSVFRDLVLDSGNVTGFTLNGAYLDGANSSPRSSAWSMLYCCVPCPSAIRNGWHRSKTSSRCTTARSTFTIGARAASISLMQRFGKREMSTSAVRANGGERAWRRPLGISSRCWARIPYWAAPSNLERKWKGAAGGCLGRTPSP
jgi:DNA invertase Pin-like site-specific DNA recombinase